MILIQRGKVETNNTILSGLKSYSQKKAKRVLQCIMRVWLFNVPLSVL